MYKHRSNSFLRKLAGKLPIHPLFPPLQCCYAAVLCACRLFLQLHKFTLISSYAPSMPSSPFLLLVLFLPRSAQPLLAPQQGHLGFHSRGGMRRNNNRTFSQNETMNEPHTKHEKTPASKKKKTQPSSTDREYLVKHF